MPPTSMWTGAVYLEAAATQGIPDILWLKFGVPGWELLPAGVKEDGLRDPWRDNLSATIDTTAAVAIVLVALLSIQDLKKRKKN